MVACGVSKSLSHKTSPTLKTKLILTMTLIIKKSLFPYPIFVLHSMFYVPRVVHESGLYPTRTQPKNFKWINLQPKTNPEYLVKSASLSLFSFTLYRSVLSFITRANIWLDLLRSKIGRASCRERVSPYV